MKGSALPVGIHLPKPPVLSQPEPAAHSMLGKSAHPAAQEQKLLSGRATGNQCLLLSLPTQEFHQGYVLGTHNLKEILTAQKQESEAWGQGRRLPSCYGQPQPD